ncbi:MAG TPA: hypothetical protein VFQ97_03205 [Gallionella sp.]|nr:hypothetical protein [Gallionella sp.]
MNRIICASVWSGTFALFVSSRLQKSLAAVNQGRSILFVELLHRMEQGFADTTTSRQGTEE